MSDTPATTKEATEAVARLLYARDGYAPWETEEANEQETYRIEAASLIAAALPHLRVQETPVDGLRELMTYCRDREVYKGRDNEIGADTAYGDVADRIEALLNGTTR